MKNKLQINKLFMFSINKKEKKKRIHTRLVKYTKGLDDLIVRIHMVHFRHFVISIDKKKATPSQPLKYFHFFLFSFFFFFFVVRKREMYSSGILRRLTSRRLLQQASHGIGSSSSLSLDAFLVEQQQLRAQGRALAPAYCGFDPTAPSLHVGSLLQLLGMRHLAEFGHPAVLLVGGATGRIGDPSGRDADRPELPDAARRDNSEGLSNQLRALWTTIDLSRRDTTQTLTPTLTPMPTLTLTQSQSQSQSQSQARSLASGADISAGTNSLELPLEPLAAMDVVNNDDWFAQLGVLDFFAGVGRHARLGAMLSRDSVRSRLDRPEGSGGAGGMSFLEFSYQLFQAYDYLHLHRTRGCMLQVGGSDQWGNVMAGCELVARVVGRDVYGVTLPLLTTAGGAKLGKSAGNAVWLDARRSSPHQLYQYLLNLPDDGIDTLLLRMTFLDDDSVAAVVAEHARAPERRGAQRTLAADVVRMVHGPDGLRTALSASRIFRGDALSATDEGALLDMPASSLPVADMFGLPLCALLHTAGLASSKREARRLIDAGAVSINGDTLRAADDPLDRGHHFGARNFAVLRVGRRTARVLRLAEDIN
jgi:tyrosyl-tRNA synthetase